MRIFVNFASSRLPSIANFRPALDVTGFPSKLCILQEYSLRILNLFAMRKIPIAFENALKVYSGIIKKEKCIGDVVFI